jgi:hypothetical protein
MNCVANLGNFSTIVTKVLMVKTQASLIFEVRKIRWFPRLDKKFNN